MAARINKRHSEEVRKRIQTSQLLNRLQDNALAEEEIMTAGQIKSAEVLLKKAIPDLKQIDISGKTDNNLTVRLVQFGDSSTT